MRDHDDIERQAARWLAAEREGDEASAEEALAALFAALPAPLPAGGFTDRVVRQVARRRRRLSLEAVAASLLLWSALAAWAAPRWLAALWSWLRPERLLGELLAPLGDLDRWLTAGASLWRGLAAVARAGQLVVISPEMLTAVALGMLLAATALRFLFDLLNDRSPFHGVGILV